MTDFVGTTAAETINGTNFADTFDGRGGDDTINALGGNDIIDGGSGADTMNGGTGNDVFLFDNAGDVAVENASEGTDTVGFNLSAGGSYTLASNIEKLHVMTTSAVTGTGNSLDNEIIGNNGSDTLSGADGDDSITGGFGDDTITGGVGADFLGGGQDSDTFVYTSKTDSTIDIFARDTITGFNDPGGSGSDTIDLAGVDADDNTAGNQGFSFIGTSAFSHTAGELRYAQVNGDTYIYGDTDGNGVGDLSIKLLGAITLISGDFVL